ncbi:hypothetical protein [Streptomyces sp. NPDC002825]|uniref:hypothetical protein n=1 Tax=Streptomyces sp. NPDC002825 TaxID=3154666 RepID=UPI00332BBB21
MREEHEPESTGGPARRRGLLIAGVALLACLGLVGYGVLDTEEQSKSGAVPTGEVTYEVTGTGTAEISYLAGGEGGATVVEKDVRLPWTKSVEAPVGKAPAVAIVLDAKGGQASCALTIRKKHIQRATATGAFGRATCTGEAQAQQG